jgi:hypothetical protein
MFFDELLVIASAVPKRSRGALRSRSFFKKRFTESLTCRWAVIRCDKFLLGG